VTTGKGFDQALGYMDEVEQHMFEVSGAAVAHSLTMNETAHIAIAATRNSFVFALALTFVVLGLMIVLQRAEFAKRRDLHIRSFSSLYAHMTRSRVTALRLFLDYLKDEPAPAPGMLQAAQGAVKELDGINDGLLRIAYSERDPRTEPLGEILQRIHSARGNASAWKSRTPLELSRYLLRKFTSSLTNSSGTPQQPSVGRTMRKS
jgi:signal transduction histidine kinase